MSQRLRTVLWWVFLVLVALGLAWAYRTYVLLAPAGTFTWQYEGQRYELVSPETVGLLLAAPILLWALGWSLADLPWQQRMLSVLFRLGFLAVLALGLSRLVRTAETSRVCTVLLVDVSDSVSPEALEDAHKAVGELVDAMPKEDAVKLVTFARHPRLVPLALKDGKLELPAATELRHSSTPEDPKPGAGTNVQSAIQLSYGLFPPGYLKRLVLLTDGVQTEGDLLSESSRAFSHGVKVHTIPYRRRPPGEVAVRELRIQDKVQIGQTFDITAVVYSSRATTARARLDQGDTLNGLDGIKKIELKPGNNEVVFKSVVRVGGEVTYALALDEIGEDKFPENNRYSVTIDVPGRPTVLYVEGQPQRATYLTSALSAQQFDVIVRSPSGFPGSISELSQFDFLIVSDVAKELIGEGAQQLVEQYVRDLGGGFLFAGGEAGFGLGGWAHTTFERILPVRMDAERKKEMPSVAMVLVVDRSGSMSGQPLEMAKTACAATVTTLEGDDLIEVIAFDSVPIRYVKFQPARYRARIQNEIARIDPGGGTEIFPALDQAFQDLVAVRARKKHVILLTDGRAETRGIRDLVQSMVADHISVTTVGLGDADTELLRMIADVGGGRYHYVPDPNSLPKIFTRETQLIARQAAVEEWFPVQVVTQADFLKGLSVQSAPLLHGYVATQMKGPPAQMILSSERGEPILARWRVGLGSTLAWTSDVKNLWAVDWLRWAGFSKFWGQLVREHMRKKHHRELDMKTDVYGGHVHAVVDAFSVDERFEDGLQSRLVVTGPAPAKTERTLELRQTAPGRYEADFDLESFGSFTLRATHQRVTDTGTIKDVGVSYGHVSNPYPLEYASFEPEVELLKNAARAAGGATDPEPPAVWSPEGEKIIHYEQLWSRFVLAAIPLLLLDLLVRRVRIFDRKHTQGRRHGPISVRGGAPISSRGGAPSSRGGAPISTRGA